MENYSGITHDQIHQVYAQIISEIHQDLNKYDVMNRLLESNIFSRAVKEHFGNQYISEKMIATEVVTSIVPDDKVYQMLNNFRIKRLLPTIEEGGVVDMIGDEFEKWFKDTDFVNNEAVSTRVSKSLKDMTCSEVILEAKKLGVYHEYEVGQAFLLAAPLLKSSFFDEKHCFIYIFIKKTKEGQPNVVVIHKNSDNMPYVGLTDRLFNNFQTGDGFVFTNKKF
jgi:hypothetical protein